MVVRSSLVVSSFGPSTENEELDALLSIKKAMESNVLVVNTTKGLLSTLFLGPNPGKRIPMIKKSANESLASKEGFKTAVLASSAFIAAVVLVLASLTVRARV